MSRLLIVTYYKYPDGDAGAVRQYSFAKLYKKAGFDVTVAGMGDYTDFKTKDYNGIPYISFRNAKNSIFYKMLNYLGFKYRLRAFLKIFGDCDYIQVVDIPPNALFYLKKYAKKHNIKLIYDSVEWYSPEQFVKGKYAVPYILKEKYNTKWIDNQFSVIAISSFLEKHFKSRGIDTVRIPVIMDIKSIPCKKNTQDKKTVFLYAGSPGKKDYLAEIVKGFSMLDKELLSGFELQLLGIEKNQLTELCGVEQSAAEYLGDSLVCLGRLPHREVIDRLSGADFTVLLRSERLRYAKAGFPTKVVESLATATPVITNLTSDLDKYLKDGYNSIIVRECSPEAFAEALKNALSLSVADKTQMYTNARKTAKEYFDYRVYADAITNFLDKEVNDEI